MVSLYMRQVSQQLRKNATKEENYLWYEFLRTYPVQFRRQVPFGHFVVGFYCASANLVLELDGSQHFEGNGPEYDAERSVYLIQGYGLHILRFTNREINFEFAGVCAAIDAAVRQYTDVPSSAPCGGTFPPCGGKAGRNPGKEFSYENRNLIHRRSLLRQPRPRRLGGHPHAGRV